ncbi:hypothetical protein Tco_0190994 [Tanacetum coccineum]
MKCVWLPESIGTSLDPSWSGLRLYLSGDEFLRWARKLGMQGVGVIRVQMDMGDKEVIKQDLVAKVVMEVLGRLLGDMVVMSWSLGTSLDPSWSGLRLHLSGDEFLRWARKLGMQGVGVIRVRMDMGDKEVTKQDLVAKVVMEVLGRLLGDMVVMSWSYPLLDFWWNALSFIGLVCLLVLWSEEVKYEKKLKFVEQPMTLAPNLGTTDLTTIDKYYESDGQSVSSYLLKMKSYLDTLERLGYAISNELGVRLILNSLNKDYDQFIQNYNIHSMAKTIAELHAMLKLHEKGIPKKVETLVVLSIREGRIHKNKKIPQWVKGKDKGKTKLAYAPKPKIMPSPKRDNPVKDSACHHCKEVGH